MNWKGLVLGALIVTGLGVWHFSKPSSPPSAAVPEAPSEPESFTSPEADAEMMEVRQSFPVESPKPAVSAPSKSSFSDEDIRAFRSQIESAYPGGKVDPDSFNEMLSETESALRDGVISPEQKGSYMVALAQNVVERQIQEEEEYGDGGAAHDDNSGETGGE